MKCKLWTETLEFSRLKVPNSRFALHGWVHQNRAILCGCGGDFDRPPKKNARFLEAPRCAISSAKKIASEPRFLLRIKWVKMVLAAEFSGIPSSAAKIASERRCAILVHSASRFSPSLIHGLCAFLPPIHGLCAFFRPLLTPSRQPHSPPPSQFTVCTSH